MLKSDIEFQLLVGTIWYLDNWILDSNSSTKIVPEFDEIYCDAM